MMMNMANVQAHTERGEEEDKDLNEYLIHTYITKYLYSINKNIQSYDFFFVSLSFFLSSQYCILQYYFLLFALSLLIIISDLS